MSIPESTAFLQDLNAAAAAARLGLDSSLDMHSGGSAPTYTRQQLEAGPRRSVLRLPLRWRHALVCQ